MFILDKIKQHTISSPDALVMVSGTETLTYGALWEQSDRLAMAIEEKMGADRSPVMVYGHKHPLMLVSFMACVKSGRAYCPVDTSMPQQRVQDIAETIGNPLVLAIEDGHGLNDRSHLLSRASVEGIVETAPPSEGQPTLTPVAAEDTYYIIFTSGSTGKPKGVEISHSALSHFTDWSEQLADDVTQKQGARFLNQAPFSFDLSVLDLYTALASGGSIFCLDKKLSLSMADMMTALEKSDVHYWVSTPSFADMCLADAQFQEALLPNLRAFLFCGEKLGNRTAQKLMTRFPKAQVINTYGPTESTVAVTNITITKKMVEAGDLPIGRCKPGTEILIDDENGEMIIKGNTVSKGYFKDPEKTAKVFFTAEDGQPCYRTGDTGYFKEDLLYYGGRIDLQVKLHGYRIELGDIESNLINMPEISTAAVLPKMQEGKVKYLQAFVVSDTEDTSNAEVKRIKAFLKGFLPEYMVPKRIVFIEKMPLTNNGKIDRKKLAAVLEGGSL